MALSLEGSEPIQSALTLPIPAGRVFMSETACHQTAPSGNRSLVQTQSRCQIPVRSQHAKTTTDHPVTSLLIHRHRRFKRPSDYQIECDPFPRPVTGRLLHGVAVRCAPTGIHRQDQRVTNDAGNPLRAQFHLLSPPSAASWLNLPYVCVCEDHPPDTRKHNAHTRPKITESSQSGLNCTFVVLHSQQNVTCRPHGWTPMQH